MNNPYTLPKKIALAAALVASAQAQAALITFDDNALASDTFFAPQDSASFISGGTSFDHTWSYDCCWGNFTYSNKQDTTTLSHTVCARL